MANNDDRSGLDLLTKVKNDIALEIGEIDPNDPLRSKRIKELHALTELSKSIELNRNKSIYEKMEALAREVGELELRDPRRADIVKEIIRLNGLISK